MSSLTNGFVLGTLSILACGYIIYDAPICRLWWFRSAGYVLYFRIIVTGLSLVLALTVLLYAPAFRGLTLFDVEIVPEHAPVLAFTIALAFRSFFAIGTRLCGERRCKYKLGLKNLNENGLAQIVYERIHARKMIMVTLENNKVYAGWPLEAPNNEERKWLRLVPEWSGYRDKQARINVETDYSSVFNMSPSERDHMLISADKIVTVQPFDVEVFQRFNP